jgi:hypothetical protein
MLPVLQSSLCKVSKTNCKRKNIMLPNKKIKVTLNLQMTIYILEDFEGENNIGE